MPTHTEGVCFFYFCDEFIISRFHIPINIAVQIAFYALPMKVGTSSFSLRSKIGRMKSIGASVL
ncbi:MAG: hypothetical protein U5L45_02090 [Saprospiraceae bacterium]|nr:hypothetical protein [Saprospiraceae bacterium]